VKEQEEKTEDTEGDSPSWLRRLGKSLAGPPLNRQELLELLREAKQAGLVDADVLWMLEGVLGVSETQVRDIMLPRSHMIVVERDTQPAELLNVVVKSGHSRFPVIGENRDEVVGLLLAKDLLQFALDKLNVPLAEHGFNVDDILRPAVFVPESKRLNVLLKEFRSSRNHMAVVVDEYAGVAGLITIEDVLEQIVGDIDDEYDQAEGASILCPEEGRYLVKGLTPIDEFNEYFGAGLSDEEFDTVGGLVMHEFGHLPKRGEVVRLERWQFSVQRADTRHIHLLQITPLDNETAQPES
jgi:magnesium and cobalt transporter